MIGIGSSNDALLQQRGKVIAIEMGAELLDPAQKLDRPRLFVVIKKERLMCQSADEMVASAIPYESRFPHGERPFSPLRFHFQTTNIDANPSPPKNSPVAARKSSASNLLTLKEPIHRREIRIQLGSLRIRQRKILKLPFVSFAKGS